MYRYIYTDVYIHRYVYLCSEQPLINAVKQRADLRSLRSWKDGVGKVS